MNESDLRLLLPVWAERLGLAEWRIDLVIGKPHSDTAYMEVDRSRLYRRAEITVQPFMVGQGEAPEWAFASDLTPEGVEASLVHELLHLVTRDMAMVVYDDLEGLLHRDVDHTIAASFRRAEEQCVDALAVALVQSFSRASRGWHLVDTDDGPALTRLPT